MIHAALEPRDVGFVGLIGSKPVEIDDRDAVFAWLASIEPRGRGWVTVWSTRLDAIISRLWHPTGLWDMDAPLDMKGTLNRAMQFTTATIFAAGKSTRIVLRSMLSWCDGGDADLHSEYGEPDTAAGRCKALMLWQRGVEDVLGRLGAERMRGSGAMTAHTLWRERYIPKIHSSVRRRIGWHVPTWGRPLDTLPHPARPGMHAAVTIDYRGAHRVLGAKSRLERGTEDDPDVSLYGGVTLFCAARVEPDIQVAPRVIGLSDGTWYGRWTAGGQVGHVQFEDVDLADTEESPIGAEWRRQRSALRAGRAEAWPGWYTPAGSTLGEIEASSVSKDHPLRRIDISDPVWSIDMRSAYPSAMREVMPMPYEWDERFDARHPSQGGPVGGVARVKLKLPSGCAPVVPIRPDVATPGVTQIWPRHGYTVTGTYCYETIRNALARGASILSVSWARSMRDGWTPCRAFVDAVYDAKAETRTAHERDAIGRLPTRLYGGFAMSSRRQEMMNTRDAVSGGYSIVARWGDRCIVQTYDRDPPIRAIPVYAATVEARVADALARAEDAIDARGFRVIGVDTDGIVLSGAPDGSGGRPDVSLPWGDRPGEWCVKASAEAAVMVRPKMWCLVNRGGRALEKASGHPRRKRESLWKTTWTK